MHHESSVLSAPGCGAVLTKIDLGRLVSLQFSASWKTKQIKKNKALEWTKDALSFAQSQA